MVFFSEPSREAKIDDSAVSSSTVYSSSKTDSTYLAQSKVRNTASTTAGDVYDVRYVNSLSTGATFVGLSDTPGSISAGQSLRGNSSGTALEFFTPSSGVTIDDTSASSSTVFSSSKCDSRYLAQSKVKNAPSVTSGDVYDATYLNTQLASKADTSHTHQISDITNLQTSLDGKLSTTVSNAGSSGIQLHSVSGQTLSLKTLAGSGLATVTEAAGVITVNGGQDSSKVDKTSIQTLAEGDSSSETDVYSCNSVYSKNQINTSVNTEAITLNNTSSAGLLNFGSNLSSGMFGAIQAFANTTRYSSMYHYATGGHCNMEWWLMRNNSLSKVIQILPNGNENVFECLTGGIKAPIFQQRDSSTVIKIGRMDSASYGVPGIAIIPLINTIHSEFQMRGLRQQGVLADQYVYFQDGSALTIQSRIRTNRHSTTHANIEISTWQNSSETKVLDIGASSSSAKTVTVTGSLHTTSYVTTDQTVFNNGNELVTKAFVESRLPTDVETPVSYTIQNAVADQTYAFAISPAENVMGLIEIPKAYTGVPASSRSVRVGFGGGDYGSGMVSIGYEALADSTGSAGQTNAVRSVAVGYQAGYNAQAANHGIYLGPYQGYGLTTSSQLRIGNSGVPQGTTGFDKAIIEGTMGTTDAGQTLRLNANTIYLGSSLPTSQPGDSRIWLNNGSLSIGAVSGGGSTFLSLTDTPSTHSANGLVYSTGSALAFTTSQIAIDGNGVEVSQLNARVNGTSNIGDNGHKFDNVFCNAIHQGNVKLVLPTVRGSVNQILKVQSVSNEVHTLHFADDNTGGGGGGGGGGGLSFTPNPIPTALARGDRTSTITISRSSGVHSGTYKAPSEKVNGIHTIAGAATNVSQDFEWGGEVDWNQDGYYDLDFGSAYAINEWILYYCTQGTNFWGYNGADKLDDAVFRIFGSNDNSTWLGLNNNDYSFYSQVTTGAWNFHETYVQFNVICGKIQCTTNMNNYRYYRIQLLNAKLGSYHFSEFEFAYKKRYEAEYT